MSIAVNDAFGRPFELDEPARRIVSLIPSISETLFRLGAGGQVAGVSDFCCQPPEDVAAKPKVGGQKNPRLDAILALKPDLVIANVEENHKRHVEAMWAAGLKVFVTYPRTVKEGIQLIRDLGVLTGTQDRAEKLALGCEKARAQIEADTVRRAPVRVFSPIWRKPYMTVNRDTYIHDVLHTCGAENIFQDRQERYPKVTLDEMADRRPDIILLGDEPFPFAGRHLEDFRVFSLVPAVRTGRLHLLDGKILSWYGPRIAESLGTLMGILLAGKSVPLGLP